MKQLRKDIVGRNDELCQNCVHVRFCKNLQKWKGSVFNLIKVQTRLFLQIDILVVFFSTCWIDLRIGMLPDLPQITTRMTLRLGQSNNKSIKKVCRGLLCPMCFYLLHLKIPLSLERNKKTSRYNSHQWEGFPALSWLQGCKLVHAVWAEPGLV